MTIIEYLINTSIAWLNSYECTLQCAAMDFEDIRYQGTGRTTVLAQHMIQSFKPGEVTPEEAHKIGRELCDKYLRRAVSICDSNSH